MKKIIFKQVLPHVFSESGDVLDSEVWKKDVTLERGQVGHGKVFVLQLFIWLSGRLFRADLF